MQDGCPTVFKIVLRGVGAVLVYGALTTTPQAANLEFTLLEAAWSNADTETPFATVSFSDGDGGFSRAPSVSWGSGLSFSGYDFKAASTPLSAVPSKIFSLGEFTHRNQPIFSAAITGVDMTARGNLDVVDGNSRASVGTREFTFRFSHDETPNFDPSTSDDIVTVESLPETETFEAFGLDFTLNIEGFADNLEQAAAGNFNSEFSSPEGGDNTQTLAAQFTIAEAPPSETFSFGAPYYRDSDHVITQGPEGTVSHQGLLLNDIDFAEIGEGSEVVASMDGIARVFPLSTFDPAETRLGNVVVIDHGASPTVEGERIFTIYTHLKEFAPTLVTRDVPTKALSNTEIIAYSAGDGVRVRAGDVIGIEGNTGNSGGEHIHWGVYSGDPTKIAYPMQRPLADQPWKRLGINGTETFLRLATEADGEIALYGSNAEIMELACGNSCTFDDRVFSDFERPSMVDEFNIIFEGDKYAYSSMIDPESPLNVEVSWPGSELALEAFRPDGSLGAFLSETDGLISFFEESPMGGLWNFRITGVETAPSGEFFRARIINGEEVAVAPIPLPASASFMLFIFAFGAAARILGIGRGVPQA